MAWGSQGPLSVTSCNPRVTSALGGQRRILVCPLGPGFLRLRLSNWNFSCIALTVGIGFISSHSSLTQCQKQRLVRPNVPKDRTSKLTESLMYDLVKQKQALCLELIKIHLSI